MVDWVFRHVAPHYDIGNNILSFGLHSRYKQRLVELVDPQPGERVLDLACGTGDITRLLAERVAPAVVVGSDISPEMMAIAERRRARDNVRWVGADATRLPFADEAFDLVTCAFAGRGFPDWPATLREVFRVLRPGGRFVNLDFARAPFAPWDALYRTYLTVTGAALGTALAGDWTTYVYIPESLAAYPGQRWLDRHMADVGFQTRLLETCGWLMAYNIGQRPQSSSASAGVT